MLRDLGGVRDIGGVKDTGCGEIYRKLRDPRGVETQKVAR